MLSYVSRRDPIRHLWKTFDGPLIDLWLTFDGPLMDLWRAFDGPLTDLWRTFEGPLTHRGPLRPKINVTDFFQTARNDSQSVWKYHSNIDFERKKVEKKLWFFKVTNLHFFFLGLFSNLVLKVKLYYCLFIDIHGLPPLSASSSMSIFHEKSFLSSWPAVAHREKWTWKFFFFLKNSKNW